MIKAKIGSYSIGDSIKAGEASKLVVASRINSESAKAELLGWDAEADTKIVTSVEDAKLAQRATTESLNKALECTTADDFSGDTPTEEVTSANIAEAIENATEETELVATENIVLDAALSIPEGKSIILNLNGNSFSLSSEEHVEALVNDGELTIKNGTITAWKIVNNGSMIVEGTEITCTAEAESGSCAIKNDGDLTINEGTVIRVPFEGSASDAGGPACIRTSKELTINGGTFESKSKRTYCVIQSDGMITVNASNDNMIMDGTHGGIAVDGGNAVINGGDYSSSEFYGLYVSNDSASAGVTVNDGKFTGKNYSVWVGSDHQTGVEAAVKINGGTFEKQLKDQSNVSAGWGTKLYGGNFKERPVDDMIPEGYGIVENTETGYFNVLPVNE